MTISTTRLLALIGWLILVQPAGRVAAQHFYSAEEALEYAADGLGDIRDIARQGLARLATLSAALEDADFRAQDKHFRKLHAWLDEIGAYSRAVTDAVTQVKYLDPRRETHDWLLAGAYIDSNAHFVRLTLSDAAASVHEGKVAEAGKRLRSARSGLKGLRLLAENTQREIRGVIRSL